MQRKVGEKLTKTKKKEIGGVLLLEKRIKNHIINKSSLGNNGAAIEGK